MQMLLAVAGLLIAASAQAAEPLPENAGSPSPALLDCTISRNGTENLSDYRLKDSTQALQWSVADIKNNHLDPAMRRMSAGDYSRSVIADLDFMLRGWPNHAPALEALVRYDLSGGKRYEFKSVECYFSLAKSFASDDIVVRLQEGYYYWRKKQWKPAESAYREALRIDPQSPDANYNLGLLFAERGDYRASMAHAAVAYRQGYPLMGLRRKLEKLGAWQTLEASQSAPP